MNIRFCLSCNKELIGRTDKKFCDAQCRSIFHNQNRPFHELTIRNINGALRSNRSLLAHYCPSGKTTVRKHILLESGYRFDVFTHLFPFKKGTYFFCYDYGYLSNYRKRDRENADSAKTRVYGKQGFESLEL